MTTQIIHGKTVVYSTSTNRDKKHIIEDVNGSSSMSKAGLTLGGYLEQSRKAAGLTIRQLGELAGVHKTIIGRLEHDQVQSPRTDDLLRLAQTLELRASVVLLLAGIRTTERPTVEALLRAEYDLPEAALIEARDQIDAIVARYQARNRKEEP